MSTDTPQRKRRVLYLVRSFPQISQTYIKTEIEHVARDNEVMILSRKAANKSPTKSHPFTIIDTLEDAIGHAKAFKPDVIHAHYVNQMDFVDALSEAIGVPYTVRAHSFDAMAARAPGLQQIVKQKLFPNTPKLDHEATVRKGIKLARKDNCLGVLTFPFTREILLGAGAPGSKLIDCWPVVNIEIFENRDQNGDGVMNTGAVIPKKKMEDFLKLATLMDHKIPFNLYAVSYDIEKLRAKSKAMGDRVSFHRQLDPEDMPAEYKKHSWLVYTGDIDNPTVGWPMAVAEAQAAGVGVAMPRLRPDVAEFVGHGAGVLYDDVSELPDILAKAPPEDMRERGFQQAKKSDIRGHLHLLTDLWPKIAA
ncbi:MAG: glycosyltransferase [Pseudomonadota bacterium]